MCIRDSFIAKNAPASVTALYEAGKKAGLSFTIEEAEALCDAVGKHANRERLDGCKAKELFEVLTALLRAGPCDGRALENEEELATACIEAGLHKKINAALMHLLNPLNEEDGPEPTKKKDKERWTERRAAARRVADLLHDTRIHLRGVPFASYDAVQKKWKDIKDDRKEKAEEAQFNADMDAVDEEEEEPKVKRPKRSCSRGGSA